MAIFLLFVQKQENVIAFFLEFPQLTKILILGCFSSNNFHVISETEFCFPKYFFAKICIKCAIAHSAIRDSPGYFSAKLGHASDGFSSDT